MLEVRKKLRRFFAGYEIFALLLAPPQNDVREELRYVMQNVHEWYGKEIYRESFPNPFFSSLLLVAVGHSAHVPAAFLILFRNFFCHFVLELGILIGYFDLC